MNLSPEQKKYDNRCIAFINKPKSARILRVSHKHTHLELILAV